MMISDKYKEYFKEKLDATVSINRKNSSPHITAVWVVLHNERIYFSTETSRVKYRHIMENNHATISIVKHRGGYVSISGRLDIRKKEEFDEYRIVLEKIVSKYVSEEDVADFMNNLLKAETRILIELTPYSIIPQ